MSSNRSSTGLLAKMMDAFDAGMDRLVGDESWKEVVATIEFREWAEEQQPDVQLLISSISEFNGFKAYKMFLERDKPKPYAPGAEIGGWGMPQPSNENPLALTDEERGIET